MKGPGTALLIPPVYILVTMYWTGLAERARAFGIVSAAGGIGAATGPLIGGWITAAFSWRGAAFGFQTLIIVIILILAIRLKDPRPAEPGRPYDVAGAVLSGLGLIVFVLGILAADNNLLLCVGLMLGGAAIIAVFFWWVRRLESKGREPLLSTAMFRSRISNLALITQNFQWMLLMGTSMLVASHLQVVRQYDAIETGIIFSAATFGILVSSLAAGSLVRRFAQRSLIIVGFRRHRYRSSAPAAGRGGPGRMALRARPAGDRARSRSDADPERQHGAVGLPRGAAGGDLRAVPQHFQPRLELRDGDRGDGARAEPRRTGGRIRARHAAFDRRGGRRNRGRGLLAGARGTSDGLRSPHQQPGRAGVSAVPGHRDGRIESRVDAEGERLVERRRGVPWLRWGPYVSERQWGTVREDGSADGDAWASFPHDHARSRAYRWGEDGLAGISDDRQSLCFALALWNGTDAILKERLFGLTNAEGNHGEDVKEYYFYLDTTPTHSYMR